MARSKKAAGVGHNSNAEPLTAEEIAALTTHYDLKIRASQKEEAKIKSLLDAQREVTNGAFAMVKADLKISRKDFLADMELQTMTEAEFRHHEEKRTGRLRARGLVGEQIELPLGDTVDDALEAEMNGYRAGRRADDPTPPESINPIFHTNWMTGYHKGQEENGLLLGKAETILATRAKAPKDGVMGAGDEPNDEDDVRAQADALKAVGWADDAPQPTPMESANGGKTVRAAKVKEAA